MAAIDLLDAALDDYGRRELLSSNEVVDLLLDIRKEVLLSRGTQQRRVPSVTASSPPCLG